MKLFHISDLHIGKQLHHYNMIEEQRDILKQIVELAKKEQPQGILIAGDIYDTAVPSAEAVSVFDSFLTDLNAIEPGIAVCIIAGNHDSAKRIDFASSILAKHHVYIAGMPPVSEDEYLKQVTLQDEFGPVHIYLLPFVKPGYVRNVCEEDITSYDMAVKMLLERERVNLKERNMILSHQFYIASGAEPKTCDSEIRMVGGIESVDASVLEPFEYAALGHIHGKQKIGRSENRYCGTPLQYSVSEAGDEKTVTVVTLGKKGEKVEITELPLKPMRQVRKLTGSLQEIISLAQGEICHDFVSITLTDEVEEYQPKERLEAVYDHILEVKIDNARTRKLLDFSEEQVEKLDPYEAFRAFFVEMNGREMTEAENQQIQNAVNEELEVTE